MNAWGHFKTITHHKLLVMQYCFRVGLIGQGLKHDLSKYSPTEFRVGMKYYTGTKSPNAAEREELGYSVAWLHHKGRNRHHLEYWIDYGGPNMELCGHPMPTRYMVELCLDRIAACRVYHGDKYTDADPLEYLNNSKDSKMMHPETKRQVVEILTMLKEKGEAETLRYLRQVVLKSPVECYPNRAPAPVDPAEKDRSFLPPETIKALAREWSTPFYLYSEEKIQKACEEIRGAFSWNPGARQFFPVKATPTAGILKLLRKEGQGVVCSSAAELELCRRCGFLPEEILFLPNFPRKEDLEKAREVGCMPVLDGPDLVDEFAVYGLLHGAVGLRVKPEGIFRFGTTEVSADGIKFGFTPGQIREIIPKLKGYGITVIGLHSYMAGNTLSDAYYPKLTEMLCDLALELSGEIGIAYLNISGGIGIPYRPEDSAPDMRQLGQAVEAVFQRKLAGGKLAKLGLYTELGRFTTGPAGALIATVDHIKEGSGKFAGVDASAADLMRPMMYGAYHHVSLVGKEGAGDRSEWDVVGSVCETTDKFAEGRMLPRPEVGDIAVIHDAGAHGHSMGYNYGGRLRCAELLLHGDGSVELLRRAETVEDYLRTQHV